MAAKFQILLLLPLGLLLPYFLVPLPLAQSLDVDMGELLLEVKRSFTEDPRRVLDDWNSDNPDYCSWSGVTCDSDSAVVALNLSASSLGGSLSPSLGRLSRLATLDLSSNMLTGAIPSQVGQLSALTTLFLYSNSLSGTIPAALGSLSSLWLLRLGDNPGLSGPIPDTFGELRNLTTLAFSFCNLSGRIPSRLGELTQLHNLVLQQNQFDGSIPPELGNLTNLQILNLANNMLRGQIPSQLGELSQLTYLNLMSNKLGGPIPGSLGKLSSLRSLDFSMNELEGEFPAKLSQLSQLNYLVLSNNKLSGRLPENLCRNATKLDHLFLSTNNFSGGIPVDLAVCRSLMQLDLSNNSLSGAIPVEISELLNLTDLLLNNNSLSGLIPREIGNLNNLQMLTLYHNELRGRLPEEIGKLQQLQILYLYENQLSGEIPAALGNCTSLQMIDFYGNQFSGSIPVTLGRLTKLSFLHLRQNDLSGEIPPSLGYCRQLTVLDLADNRLSGVIPATFGLLHLLEQFMLYNNSLEGRIPDEMISCRKITRVNLSNNKFNGSILPLCGSSLLLSIDLTNNSFNFEIPAHLGNSPMLSRIRLGNNRLTGEVPAALGEIMALSLLDLSINSLTGAIPVKLAACKNLTHIILNDNRLTGVIPPWIGSLPWIGEMNLSSNSFFGPIPVELFNCSNLLKLSLDNNLLNGSLPSEISKLASLNVLNLAHNKLSGLVPASIGKLSKLYDLRLSENRFSGPIPSELGQLQELQSALDLSFNNLTGGVPASLASLVKLENLNISHNSLTGEVPAEIGDMQSLVTLDLSNNGLQGQLDEAFSRWPQQSFAGNHELCGQPLQPCSMIDSAGHHSTLNSGAVATIAVFGVIFTILLLIAVIIWIRKWNARRSIQVNLATSSKCSSQAYRELITKGSTWHELKWETIMEATSNLSDEFVVGSGGSGTVYKAELPTGEAVAVKKILHSSRDSLLHDKSFLREIETLGRIKHRNLVKLLGYVSSNAGQHLLIYEYMENGSLWDWLHKPGASEKKKRELSWEARLKIAIGLARGVEYLHHDSVPRIVHRDIKSSNLLIDGAMEAHLGDFGLAKPAIMESHIEESRGYTESGSCFAGTYGYIAPECAYSLKATEKSDVYSMGVVLMELVTGLMPIDRSFGDLDMVRWVQSRIVSSERDELLDSALKSLVSHEESSMFEVLDVALKCTRAAPAERPSARQVADVLLDTCMKSHRMKNGRKNFIKILLELLVPLHELVDEYNPNPHPQNVLPWICTKNKLISQIEYAERSNRSEKERIGSTHDACMEACGGRLNTTGCPIPIGLPRELLWPAFPLATFREYIERRLFISSSTWEEEASGGADGGAGDFRANVWSMTGGPYCRPKHWKRNTAIAMFSIFLVCIPIAMKLPSSRSTTFIEVAMLHPSKDNDEHL
ncbi:hypothetical protein Cni_G13672 [Canna indica]|uniref:non-specific serine/threonine protein kinase n=1 Tax=Canna indica TaxID=4628 RepID=A0AAQ3QBQ1_9LILI|nr:hypothetical protein Cni_G13672 [Canna indica]